MSAQQQDSGDRGRGQEEGQVQDVIWILIEIGIIHEFGWIQTVYVVAGLLQLVLVFALLGIVSWLPRESRGNRRNRSTIRPAHAHELAL